MKGGEKEMHMFVCIYIYIWENDVLPRCGCVLYNLIFTAQVLNVLSGAKFCIARSNVFIFYLLKKAPFCGCNLKFENRWGKYDKIRAVKDIIGEDFPVDRIAMPWCLVSSLCNLSLALLLQLSFPNP